MVVLHRSVVLFLVGTVIVFTLLELGAVDPLGVGPRLCCLYLYAWTMWNLKHAMVYNKRYVLHVFAYHFNDQQCEVVKTFTAVWEYC